MKKMAMVVLCVMMLSTVAIVNDAAATTVNPDWYNCAVQSCGALTTFGFVFATCAGVGGGGTWADSRVFVIDTTAAIRQGITCFGVDCLCQWRPSCALYTRLHRYSYRSSGG